MNSIEASQAFGETARAMAQRADSIPPIAIKREIQSYIGKIERLLAEEYEVRDIQGTIEKLKPLVRKWQQSGTLGELQKVRNLRRLAFLLDNNSLSEPVLLKNDKASALIQAMQVNWRDSYLTPLIMVYLKNFFEYTVPGSTVGIIRDLIVKKLFDYKGSRTVPLAAKLFSDAMFIKSSPHEVGKLISASGQDWFTACEQTGLIKQLQETAFLGTALLEYIMMLEKPEDMLKSEIIEKMKILGDPDIIKAALAILVIRFENKNDKVPQITSLVFSMIGDPMIHSHWVTNGIVYQKYNVKLNQARLIVSAWINNQVLEYFFSKADMDGGRKAFWLKYAKKMSRIRIVMHIGYSFGYRFSSNNDLNEWIQKRLVRVDRNTDDIGLVMEYGEWAIVEIGSVGNACYIYRQSNRIIQNLSKSISMFNDLKRTSLPTFNEYNFEGEGRIIHVSDWEFRLQTVLRKKMGLVR